MSHIRTLILAVGRPLLGFLLLMASCASSVERGPVVAVGGGGTPDAVVRAALELAAPDGAGARVVVIPHASAREDRGIGSAAMWRDAGAREALVLSEDTTEARRQLEAADLIWMGGGDQDRLLDHLEATHLDETVRAASARGVVVGGTSAGAAVLGALCIAGGPEPAPYHRGAMQGRPGLDLVPNSIVDQHFAERNREGRLFTAVLEANELLGIGIGERTAAIFTDEEARIIGEGVVLVMDARRAKVRRGASPDPRHSAVSIEVHVLRAGDRLPR